MPTIKHWLYGEKKYEVLVEQETECHKCFHKEVCNYDREKRCSNYEFGRSDYSGCPSCLKNYARHDKEQPILCFHCKNFKDEKKFQRIEKLNTLN